MAVLKKFILLTYYRILVWWDDFNSELAASGKAMQQREQSRRNEVLARGVKQLVGWMRSLSPEERQKLVNEDANILMRAGRRKELSKIELMQRARIAVKQAEGASKEGEAAMAETFVKNQEKYKLLNARKQLHRDLRDGKIAPAEAKLKLQTVSAQLRKYE